MTGRQQDITLLLQQLGDGNRDVVDALVPLVYTELRGVAEKQMRRERANHTLGATALVNEAYLKLVDQNRVTWKNRAHFFAIAAQAMRRILVNYAQARVAQKRGGGQILATYDDDATPREARAADLVALDEALERLAVLSDRQAKVVEFRFFAGLNQDEIAEVLGVSVPTVRRDWRVARAWLSNELRED